MVKCDTCGREFKDNRGLSSHQRSAHLGIKNTGGNPYIREGRDALSHPELNMVRQSQPLKVALGELCDDCQTRVKDRLFEQLPDEVEVSKEPSGSGVGWLLLALLGLAWYKGRGQSG